MTDPLDQTLASVREDFAVATLPDGGLLLHLPSGDFFPLDGVTARVWDVVDRGGGGEATIAQTASALHVPASEARGLLANVLDQAITLRGRRPAIPPVFWEDERALSLRDGTRTLMSLDKRSLILTVTNDLRQRSDEEMAAAFRVFVPKIFGRWFPLAMHASAVGIGDRTILFCGESGAGKTTTARTLAEEIAGVRVYSEDAVVFRDEGGVLVMIEGAEAAIQTWMLEVTAALIERREPSHDVSGLRRALDAEPGRLPIHKAVFLSADRRTGDHWVLGPLSPAATLGRLFLHSFFHSPDPRALRDHLLICRVLAGQIGAAEAVAVPAGLPALRSSSRAQIETIAS